MKQKRQILFILVLVIVLSKTTLGQNKETDSLFKKIRNNPNTKLSKSKYPKNIIKEFHKLNTSENEWIAFKEYYGNGELCKKGVFLNGYNYGIWKEYNSKGHLIRSIDYSIPMIIIGKPQAYQEIFNKCKLKGDSILKVHFDTIFFKKHIRLNAPKSYWYTKNSSGSWFEYATEKPKEFTLRYSIVISDSVYFTPIEISFKTKGSTSVQGIPKDTAYRILISFEEASRIAKNNNYTITHNTAFKSAEYLSLLYEKDKYYWTISSVPEVDWHYYKNSNSSYGVPKGKTLLIDCVTGKTSEINFEGMINVCN